MSTAVTSLSSTLQLELALQQPEPFPPTDEPNKLAVLLHPWSWLGGTMNDPVLQHFRTPLRATGFHVLAYNSRGVGRSPGWPSLTGLQEADDLRALVRWALARIPDVQHVLLVGYSHGALIASQFAPLPAPTRTSHILLSYPLGPRPFLTLFRSRAYAAALTALAHDPRAHVLLLFGDADEFTRAESYRRWAEQLQAEAASAPTSPHAEVAVHCVPGATHFWSRSKADEMLRLVLSWLVDVAS
ncbi:Alpha/Beta hydrolase protein [Phellopilus nigrolimitatus]|nr:Alpha/Beta hydrolase protein [Phellopilus nigrolimitatus]